MSSFNSFPKGHFFYCYNSEQRNKESGQNNDHVLEIMRQEEVNGISVQQVKEED